MLHAVFRKLIPDFDKSEDPVVRSRTGALSGAVGIALNLLLFAGKLAAGLLAGAISIVADAFNNLSDAAASVITLVGFRLAGQHSDADHPFGHGRAEYLAGLAVSLMILLVGFELGKSSVDKILHPAPAALSPLTVAILAAAIAIKLVMWCFYSKLADHIHSKALTAAADDSRSDALATGAVLLGLVLSHFTQLALDGWVGLLVAVYIFRSGLGSIKATLDPLLGQAADPELVHKIEVLVLSHPQIIGIHDLMIHDYGPGRRVVSLHAEVDARSDLLEAHEVIDHIERDLAEQFRLEAVLHMDPVQLGNPLTDRLRDLTERLARDIHPGATVHDFRITAHEDGTKLIFDVVVPYEIPLTDGEVEVLLAQKLAAEDPSFQTVIRVDRAYVV